MKHLLKILAAGFALTGPAQTALAADMSACQILILETLEVEDIAGEAQIASYFPATDFINSAQDDIPGHLSDVNGQKIRALMCTRNDIIPAETDYALLATGVPFVVSQDFDSMDTDSLTVKWIEGHFKYAYKGQPLSDEAVTLLKTRLAQFSERGLTADLRAAVETEMTLEPGARALVPTGFAMALPAGFEAQIRPRSGLAYKHGITCLNTPGTIDADYRGEVKVLLINHGSDPFTITRGERIAQMVIAPITQPDFLRVEDLDETLRGVGGFGSTGTA